MKELIVIRHGEADHLISGVVGGWSDSNLTELGRRQALATGERLKIRLEGRSVSLYSSDLARASDTAQIIGEKIAVSLALYEELRELNNGQAANLSKEAAKKIGNPLTEPVLDWIPYPQAESWRMLHTRLAEFLNKIEDDQSDVVIVVSHSNAIISLIHCWLELPPDLFKVSFDIDPCSITSLRLNEWKERTISKLNDTSHLSSTN